MSASYTNYDDLEYWYNVVHVKMEVIADALTHYVNEHASYPLRSGI